MFKNYWLATFRNLYRERAYVIINLMGLSVGIACCVILALYLKSEFSYDKHFYQHDRIFRLASERNTSGVIDISARVAFRTGPYLTRDFPEVLDYVNFTPTDRFSFRYDSDIASEGNESYWDNTYIVDENVFEIFSHDILYGDPNTALMEPRAMAVSESFANRYFGSDNPIGKLVSKDREDYTITLVFADLPENTHLKYDVLISRNEDDLTEQIFANQKVKNAAIFGNSTYTYVVMPENYDLASFETISQQYFEEHLQSRAEGSNTTLRYFLEPIGDIHLNSITERDLPRGNKFYLMIFTTITALVLLVACINYINLATARFTNHSLEVAIRKMLGARRLQLILQFLGEPLLFSLLALAIGLLVSDLVLNVTFIDELFGKTLTMQTLISPPGVLIAIGASVLLGISSGIFPAFYLSSITPITVLKGSQKSGRGGSAIRQGLVFFQFMISVTVISCAIFMFLQMDYLQKRPVGFERENKITMVVWGADNIERLPAFVSELGQYNNIASATVSRKTPGEMDDLYSFQLETDGGEFIQKSVGAVWIDEKYLDTLGIELLFGRQLNSTDIANVYVDGNSNRNAGVLVNETLVERMGWQEPLGKRVGRYPVIGIVKDFHFQDLHHSVEPLVLMPEDPAGYIERIPNETREQQNRVLTINISGANVSSTLQYLREKWLEFNPTHAFEFSFLEEILDKHYTSDQRQMQLIGLFAGLCIFISCMGLFGLCAFTTEQRTQEIGIRKVLGASSIQIILLLFSSILNLVLVAAIVACGISYWLVGVWLDGFYYQGNINPLVFLITISLVTLIAFLTMAAQSYKTAQDNPVLALRYE